MLNRFHDLLKELCGPSCTVPRTTLVFDKGNNSADNFILIDSLGLHFVGSVKLGEHKDLARIPKNDPAFEGCKDPNLKGTKALRVEKKVYSRNRMVVVTYNQNLFNAQWLTVQNDIAKAVARLSLLNQKLKNRVDGVIAKGKVPTLGSGTVF